VYEYLWPLRRSASALTTNPLKFKEKKEYCLLHTYFKFVLSVSECGRLSENPKVIAVWREKLARVRDLPRAWILPDADIFSIAQGAAPPLNERLAASLSDALEASSHDAADQEPGQDGRPTPEQKALIERLSKIVDSRAAELKVSAEILAPRGELKALAMGSRDSHALTGWRREEIGTRLLEAIG